MTCEREAPFCTEGGLRAGEIAIGSSMVRDAALIFIGQIETPWLVRGDCPRQGDRHAGPLCHIRFDPLWGPALDGIGAADEMQVLYWMHEARRDLVRLAPKGGAPRGPFALRAPTRPNPIASSIVTLIGHAGTTLAVRGLDCVSGTPLLDIKPWRG